MRYYILDHNYDEKKHIICEPVNLDYRTDRRLSYGGARVEKWDDGITFLYPDQKRIELTDYLMNVNGFNLVSKKFVRLAQEYLGNTQVLDVRLQNKQTGECSSDYQVINVTDFIDQDDLIFGKAENYHIFRLIQDSVNIFISEKIAAVIQENGLTGFAGYEVFSPEEAESMRKERIGKKKFKIPYTGDKDLTELFFEWFDRLLQQEIPTTVRRIVFELDYDDYGYCAVKFVGTGAFDEMQEDYLCQKQIVFDEDVFIFPIEVRELTVRELLQMLLPEYRDEGNFKDTLAQYDAVLLKHLNGEFTFL